MSSTINKTHFENIFEISPSVEAQAYGRVNLIGEHTDYNQGFVLPTTIPQSTKVCLRARPDKKVRLASANQSSSLFEYNLGSEERGHRWTDYIQGLTQTLGAQDFKLQGFDAYISSDVPMGGGLSSSAALEVAVLRGLNELFTLGIDDFHIAQLAQKSENEFVGAHVGLMDPLASSLGQSGRALFVDFKSFEYRHITIPAGEVELLIIDSGIRHRNVDGGYNKRRQECEEACSLLGIQTLRTLNEKDLRLTENLPKNLAGRCRHVVTENARVLKAVECLKNKNFDCLGQLFKESHLSMSVDYEVSVPEIDTLVAIANSHQDILGARMTGGGFGGAIVALTEPGKAKDAGLRISSAFKQKTNLLSRVLVPA